MSSTDEQRAISGSSAGGKRIRLNLDESTTSAKVYIEMPAAHKKFRGDVTEKKQMLEELESPESSCNNCKRMAEEYQKKVEELSADYETLKRAIKLMSDGADAFQTSEQSDKNQESIQLSANGVVFGNFFYKRKAGMKVEYVICTFSLCTDVLDGVLQFGTRRKLSKLECIGRRFHFVIANRFVERPLLVLRRIRTVFNEKLWKSDKEAFESESGFDKFKAILEAPGVEGYHSEEVSGVEFVDSKTVFLLDAEITDLPPFLRTEEVEVENRYLNSEKFQKYVPLFQQLKPALVGSKLILGTINKDNREFVKEELLPFFDCCKRYKFHIERTMKSPKDISDFIASILQLPLIESRVGIEFNQFYMSFDRPKPGDATSLPIEAISNWLHKPAAVESNKAIGEKRSLRIYLSNIENISEMVEHLKKAFKAAKASVVPFTLHLSRKPFSGGPIEDERILNHLSLEELSIQRREIQYDSEDVTIERDRIKNEKNIIKKGKKH